jgi:hypothetical protein
MNKLLESIEKAVTKLYRKRIARRLFETSSGKVERGPFAGMKLIAFSHISSAPLALKLYGLYEKEVLDFLVSLTGRTVLVNLGAGEGYYSVGLIRSGTVERSLAFEIDEKGRAAIATNAEQNGVAGRIKVFGAADGTLARTLAAEGVAPGSAIILCDIEGAEFSVIDDALASAYREAVFVIELHPFAVEGGEALLAALIARLAPSHELRRVKAGHRDWVGIPALEALNDNARALAVSEGRKLQAEWLFAVPKS